MSNEDKMRESADKWNAIDSDFLSSDSGAYTYHLAAFQEGAEICAAIKDAEIAARDLMIKELREALLEVSAVGMHYEESSRIYWTCPSCEFDETSYPERVKHAPECALNNAIAKSEHHNSRALEKMLLEARIDEINRLSCWHPLEGNWEEFVRAQAQDYEIRLAELTNQSLSNTGE